MNYWPALTTNLAECQTPLDDAITDLSHTGASVAKEQYGARGWVTHHNFDICAAQRRLTPRNHGIWVVGGAWLCQHLWEQYLFTGDKKFLAEKAYPAMKGASEFFLDFLVKDPRTGYLISGPSNSPEQGGLVMGPTMDHEIIRSLFANTAAAAAMLDATPISPPSSTKPASDRPAPDRQAWASCRNGWKTRTASNDQHRACLASLGIYPGAEITSACTPSFSMPRGSRSSIAATRPPAGAWAGRSTLGPLAGRRPRLQASATCWCPSARLPARAGSIPNLFDAHPPFQIDGNFGCTAGVARCSCRATRARSPAARAAQRLAERQREGPAHRGGFTVDIAWKKGKLTEAKIVSDQGSPFKVRYGEKVVGEEVEQERDVGL